MMGRGLAVFFAIGWIWTAVLARNETLHACELVIKCFDDADVEVMKCQAILSEERPAAPAAELNDDPSSTTNETTLEPPPTTTTTVAPESDDCMAAVKLKMQQKRALVEQRAQAFTACLNQRMDRGPEDVDQRKFRYCNTVISRYQARTTVSVPPEFTLPTTISPQPPPNQPETPSAAAQSRLTSISSSSISTANRRGSSPLVTFSPPGVSRGASTPILRPRRQVNPDQVLELEAPTGLVAANGPTSINNGSGAGVPRPPGVSPPGKRPEITSTTPPSTSVSTQAATKASNSTLSSTTTAKPTTTDPFDQPSSTTGSPPIITQETQIPIEGTSGRLAAVARFSSPLPGGQDQTSLTNNTAAAGFVRVTPAQQPAVPGFGSDTTLPPSDLTPSPSTPDAPLNFTLAPPKASNNSYNASPVLVQQQEQAENGVVQSFPFDQPIEDVQDQEVLGASPPSAVPPSSSRFQPPTLTSTSTTTATPPAPPALTTLSSISAEERERNRVDALRESRRRVSEFKACMARSRTKREECKPLVNCCPDSVKCHLRYELSELHDQIHRLELEISESRQACLAKKKLDETSATVDALDQIDEEDLISDESIVSQQVF